MENGIPVSQQQRGRCMFRKCIALSALLPAIVCFPASDEPSVEDWEGTGYRSGWFTYGVKADEGGAKIDTLSQFVLSPEYPAPVRKVVLKVECTKPEPTRALTVKPLVAGTETADESLWRKIEKPGAENVSEFVHFDWDESAGVNAVRICLEGTGSTGDWLIGEIHVFYGEKDAGEDETVRDLVKVLPAPSVPEIPAFTANSLTACVGTVEFAAGYVFDVHRLVGDPRTEVREDFASAPALSEGWTATLENAKFESYTSSSYYDTENSTDKCSLKFNRNNESAGTARAELVSPVMPLEVTECSFMYRLYSASKSNVLKLYGGDGAGGDWVELGSFIPETSAKTYPVVAIEKSAGVRQLKFVIEADKENFSTAALDAITIVCGGGEERLEVETSQELSAPGYSLSGLETARYAVRAKALAEEGSEYGDSEWSEEGIVDLAWAELVAGEPTGVTCETADGKFRVSWGAAVNAGYYIVKIRTTGVPSEVVAEIRTTSTSVDLELPELGEYSVTVTAYSPGGVSSAAAAAVVGELELGAVGKVTATGIDRQTLGVNWPAVALCEGYRVEVFELGGEVLKYASDYSGLPDVWQEGWTHDQYLVDEVYSGPFPKMTYDGCWIATCAYPLPVTEISYSFKSHSSEEITAVISMAVDVSATESGDEWEEAAVHQATRSRQELSVELPYSANVRRIRFRMVLADKNPNIRPAVELGDVEVTCGERTLTEVASLRTEETSATVGGLPVDGIFTVRVTPLPSEGDGLSSSSAEVDLSLLKPREIEPAAISDFAGGAYVQDFAVFAGVTKETDVKELVIPEWQFFKGDDEAGTLKFTATGKATAGGVYVIAAAEDSADMALGSLSTGSFGCTFGVAFTNDLQTTVESAKLSFAAIQRSFKAAPKTYVLEYAVTSGGCRIDGEEEWTGIEIPVTAPLTSETCGEAGESRITVGPVEFPAVIPPGGALLVRWSDEKGSSSPMMGIDDVRFECAARPRSLTLILR